MKAIYKFITIFLILCTANTMKDMPGSGIHDYIHGLQREDLEKWALAAEKYHKVSLGNDRESMGGLHDYIRLMSNNELKEYITKEAQEHPEINSVSAFKALIEKHSIQGPRRHKVGGDGGLSSMLWRTERETLIKWALACEKYHNNGQIILGGLHDILPNMTREDLLIFIRKETKEHDELNHLGRLNQLAGVVRQDEEKVEGIASYLGSFLRGSEKKEHVWQIGGIHDYIFQAPREKLETWALAVEEYVRNVKNVKVLGGIHDYISIATNQEIASYILDMAKKYEELDSIDLLNKISEEKIKPKYGGLHDYIWRVPREKLVTWALAIETYVRDQKNGPVLGGIHDYIHTMSNEDIVKYILDNAKLYKELNSSLKLDEISQIEERTHKNAQFGGLHDYIYKVPREKLVDWALHQEKYIKEVKKIVVFGGIHDYIYTMSNEEIIKYILSNARKFEELNSATKLDKIVNDHYLTKLRSEIFTQEREKLAKWGIACENFVREVKEVRLIGGLHDYIGTATVQQIGEYILSMAEKYEELNTIAKLEKISETTKSRQIGGLHDYIFRTDKEKLKTWALSVERYVREVKKVKLLGGIHDYINVATVEQMGEYILKMAKQYEELNSGEKLDKISEIMNLKATRFGGLHDYIFRVPREKLVFWALACENYSRQWKKELILGGIHDYIQIATNETIIEYILERAQKYPELNSAEKLDGIAAIYKEDH